MLNGIITLIMALGLMLTGAVTLVAKCLEIGVKSAQAVSIQDETKSQDN